jgi:GNAT superfamily N-acetyltransferase
MDQLEIYAVRADRTPARELIEEMIGELAVHYGRIDTPGAPSATPEEMWAPRGTFLVISREGRALAGGGVKPLGDDLAEIKRMYVRPGARGRGMARRLLGELEEAARELGYERARLDTGPRQPHAEALYRSAGYVEIADYNRNPAASFWAEKRLR